MPNGVAGKRVMVTGGAGFVGRRVCALLERRGAAEVFVPRSRDYDLTRQDAARRAYHAARPDTVVHLAAEGGGISANRANPGRYLCANIGQEITIRELARTVGRLTGYDGEIEWDRSRPDGQPRRRLDTSRAREWLGFEASIPLEDGLRGTIEWFRAWHPAVAGRVAAGGPAL